MPALTWMKRLNNPSDQNSQQINDQNMSEIAPVCYLNPGERLREGMICPRCHSGSIEYNGLLNLVCSNCGLTEAGACT